MHNYRVAFDLGNVLFDIDMNPLYKAMYNYGLSTADVDIFLERNFYLDFNGTLHIRQAIQMELERSLNLRNSDLRERLVYEGLAEVVNSWNKCITLNEQMSNFVANLKSEGVKIAILSNIGKEHAEFALSKYPDFFKMIDVKHFSYEVGASKPQKLFFQSFLLDYNEYSGCVFLDDRRENVLSAGKFRFDAVHFDLKELTKDKLPSILKKKLISIRNRILNERA